MQHVLVLNASYEPLNVCSFRRAHVLVYKGKAEVIERLDQPLRSSTGSFIWPHVIRLLHYVRVPRAIQRKISRRALFARDGWKCAYCGTAGGRLTLDHVVPRSKGGESIWENVVAACAPCNLRKGDRTVEQRRSRCSSSSSPRRASRNAGVLTSATSAPRLLRLKTRPLRLAHQRRLIASSIAASSKKVDPYSERLRRLRAASNRLPSSESMAIAA